MPRGVYVRTPAYRAKHMRERPSYVALHTRLRKTRGRAQVHTCTRCGGPAQEWALIGSPMFVEFRAGHAGKPYSTDLSAYEPMCCSCHRKEDAA